MDNGRIIQTRGLLGSSLWKQRRLGLGVGQCALVSSLLANSKLDIYPRMTARNYTMSTLCSAILYLPPGSTVLDLGPVIIL